MHYCRPREGGDPVFADDDFSAPAVVTGSPSLTRLPPGSPGMTASVFAALQHRQAPFEFDEPFLDMRRGVASGHRFCAHCFGEQIGGSLQPFQPFVGSLAKRVEFFSQVLELSHLRPLR